MIIDNPDAFKAWLTTILEPLCDADPAALAKYVYALVKKDKPLEELRDGMLDQLDVFLQQETKPFVDMLFKSLESQEYLAAAAAVAAARPPTPPPEPPADDIKLETENDIHAPVTVPAPPRPRSPPARHRVVVRAKPAPPPPQPRAPPMEQTLVKVLPLTELLEEPVDQPPRRRDRRPDMIRDGGDRRRRRSRSWERRARARRPPRDEHERRDDRGEIRRRMSRSPSPRGRYRNRSPPAPAIGIDRSRSRSPVPVRDRDHDRERDRLRVPREMERDRMSRDRDRVSRSRDRDRSHDRSRERSLSPLKDRHEISDAFKRRCRDFDEKGYCMRGDLCQWDHGVDPVVLEDAALTRVLTLPPPVPEYNPLTPDIWCGNAFPAYGAPPPRELIPIPRYARPVRHDPPGPPMSQPPPRHPNPIKKSFDYNRIGANRMGSSLGGQCALEVKKVPRGLNDITHLNNHFSKFGKIVNIQVCFKEDPEGALITFATPAEASVAYKSTEAVLNNRFIKVFWHNPEQNKQDPTPTHPPAPAPTAPHGSHNKVLINRENVRATHNTKMAAAAKAKETALAKEPLAANGQEPRKDGPAPQAATPTGQAAVPQRDNKVVEMSRRAQALLETQLQQQRLLIERLEKGNVSEPQRAALMEAINSSQEGIENLRRELLAYNNSLRQMQEETVSRSMSRLQLAQTKKPKTREEAQKEILDAELDMFTKQQEGQDVTELMKKVAELRRQMALQFPSHNSIRRPHARGGRFAVTARPRGGGAAGKVFANQSVDHRPRALLVSGFEPDELDALVGHFSQFGEITGKEARLAVPELVLQYRARAHAEHAALRGRHYNDRTLTITWVTSTKPIAALPAANGDVAAARDNSDEPSTIADTVSAALSRDDDEDDEEEDRSWRR